MDGRPWVADERGEGAEGLIGVGGGEGVAVEVELRGDELELVRSAKRVIGLDVVNTGAEIVGDTGERRLGESASPLDLGLGLVCAAAGE